MFLMSSSTNTVLNANTDEIAELKLALLMMIEKSNDTILKKFYEHTEKSIPKMISNYELQIGNWLINMNYKTFTLTIFSSTSLIDYTFYGKFEKENGVWHAKILERLEKRKKR